MRSINAKVKSFCLFIDLAIALGLDYGLRWLGVVVSLLIVVVIVIHLAIHTYRIEARITRTTIEAP